MHERGEEVNDIDRALAAALNVDASPDFMARVRRRIADDPLPVRFWRGWRLAVPAAAAVLAIVTVVVFRGMWRHTERAPSVIQARQIAVVPFRLTDVGPVLETRTAKRAVSSRVPVASSPVRNDAEPEVLVPRAEIEMYRRLIAAAQNVRGALVVEAPKDIQAGQAITDIAINPITIDPLVPLVSGEGVRK